MKRGPRPSARSIASGLLAALWFLQLGCWKAIPVSDIRDGDGSELVGKRIRVEREREGKAKEALTLDVTAVEYPLVTGELAAIEEWSEGGWHSNQADTSAPATIDLREVTDLEVRSGAASMHPKTEPKEGEKGDRTVRLLPESARELENKREPEQPGESERTLGDRGAEERLEQERVSRVAASHSRYGIATKLGFSAPFDSSQWGTSGALGGWVGGRYAFRDRAADGTGLNFAVALLPGIEGRGTSALMAGLEARLELLGGNRMYLLEPPARAYLVGGFSHALESTAFEGYLGLGVGFDVLFNGLSPFEGGLGGGPSCGSIGSAGGSCAAIGLVVLPLALFLMTPTLELVYTVRSNGESFPAVAVALGL